MEETMELINISGEPREWEENGFIYEFPCPTSAATVVPKSVGEKLLQTKQFKQVNIQKIVKDKSIIQKAKEIIEEKNINEVQEDDI